jgi:polyvinyl alcohol dehydrogenase (cytochrome)
MTTGRYMKTTGRRMKRRPSRRRAALLGALVVASAALSTSATAAGGHGPAPAPIAGAQWAMGGHDLHDTRDQAAETILGPATMGDLAPAWTFTTGGDVSATPLVAGGAVYIPDWSGHLYKVDARTGRAVWSRTIARLSGMKDAISRVTPALLGNTLYLGDQGRVITAPHPGAHILAVDAATGALRWSTAVTDPPAAEITSSPVAYGGRVFVGVSSSEEDLAARPGYRCCVFRGRVLALDAATGKILWRAYTVPPGYNGASVWGSTPVIDTKRGLLYATTGNAYRVPPAVAACQNAGKAGCLPPAVHIDSIIALDLATGALRWAARFSDADAWNVACNGNGAGIANCPAPQGPDFDFGQGPILFTATVGGRARDLLGAGQKSGVYWALDPDTGAVVWSTRVGPGGVTGGIQWGSATDGRRVYVADANSGHAPQALVPSGRTISGGSWSALDAATGKVLWQTADPSGSADPGAVTVANGVVYAGSMDAVGHMYALDAATGRILWRFASGGSVASGAAVVDGRVYWGSGYEHLNTAAGKVGTANDKLYAFSRPR